MKLFFIPLIVSIIIVVHHFIKHQYDTHLSFFDKIVQISDIDNHETWALFFLGISIGMTIISFKKPIETIYKTYMLPANDATKGLPDAPINDGHTRVASFVALS